jgi:hypothetical protein
MMKPDLREKLGTIGKVVAKNRFFLLQMCAAIIIQRVWKKFQMRRIRTRKAKTKHMAAVKIQAVWKGFWVRSSNILLI